MSNTSDYAMKIIGSKENITKLVNWLCAGEKEERHFYGMSTAHFTIGKDIKVEKINIL